MVRDLLGYQGAAFVILACLVLTGLAVGAVRLIARGRDAAPATRADTLSHAGVAIALALLSVVLLLEAGVPRPYPDAVAMIVGGGSTFPLARRYRPGASFLGYLAFWVLGAALVILGERGALR